MSPLSPADRPSVTALVEEMWTILPGWGSSPPTLYAVLDGARDARIHTALRESTQPYRCLFEGKLDAELAAAAPYLVQLGREAPLTHWLLEEGWGESWGIFAASYGNLEMVRRHFRRLLRVRDEQGRSMYFRYYDPRVLGVYLPTCTDEEKRAVFGPVARMMYESKPPPRLCAAVAPA